MDERPNESGMTAGGRGGMLDDKTARTVKDTAEQVQDRADRAAREVREDAAELGQEARNRAREMASDAQDMAISRAEDGRRQVAEGIHNVSEALRMGAQRLREQNDGANTQFAERLAEPIDRVSDYIEQHDTRELASELEDFARRNQAAFVGGAFAIGMLGARFLKSSAPSSSRSLEHRADDLSRRALPERTMRTERDSVGRPQAPGYAPPSERASHMGDPKSAGPRDADL